MRKFFLLVMVLFTPRLIFAQFSITGQVKDAQIHSPIPYATVIVLDDRDSAITMAMADGQGFFTIQMKQGKYSILLRYLGYKDDTLSLYVDSDRQVGVIYLEPRAEELEGVTVKASKRKIDLDRQEVIITKEMKSRAPNVNELLNQVNGITYDRYNNQLSVDGHTNILILVNGLKKDYNYIQSLNPDRILKLQIIRDPGGRYGLEGYYAVINIVLKDNYQGVDTYVVGSALFDPDAPVSHVNIHQHDIANLIYTKGKVNFYINQSYYNNQFWIDSLIEKRFYVNGFRQVKQGIDNPVYYHGQMHNITTGIDYQINPLNVVSLELKSTMVPFDPSAENSTSYVQNFWDSVLVADYVETAINRNGSWYYGGTVFYKGSFSKLDIESDLNLGRDLSHSQTQLLQDGNYLVDNEVDNQTDALEFNAEGTYYMGNLSLNAGLGYITRSLTYQTINHSGQLSGEEATGQSQDVRLRSYGYISWKMNNTVSLKVGSAVERYLYSGPEGDYRQWITQPFVNFQLRMLNDLLVLTAKYRANTTYPTAQQLNPAVVVLDSGIAQMGNPSLHPYVINNLSVNMQIMKGLLTVEPYYSFSNNYIALIGRSLDDMPYNVVYSYENVGKYINRGLRVNFIVPFSKSVIWKNDMDFYWSDIQYDTEETNVHDWTGSSQLIYYNPKVLTAGLLYQNYLSKRITAQGYRSNGNDFIGMFAQKGFFDQKLTLTLFYIFPLHPDGKWINYTLENYTQTPVFEQYQRIDLSLLKNIFNVELEYRFSRGKVMKIKKPEQQLQRTKLKSIL